MDTRRVLLPQAPQRSLDCLFADALLDGVHDDQALAGIELLCEATDFSGWYLYAIDPRVPTGQSIARPAKTNSLLRNKR